MLETFVLFGFVFLISVVSIFCVLVFTRRLGLFDKIDERKVHTGNIPRLGGIGIFVGFLLGLIAFALVLDTHNFLGPRVWNLVVGCALIFVMGVWDDMKTWRARFKLGIQILAALVVIAAGFTFHTISFSALGFKWDMGWLRYVVTFLWIIGVTNAVNLIDGIDGLAGTVSILASLTFGLFFFQSGNMGAFYVCVLLALAIAGFLVFNLPLPRAKIFMGDGGSQFLGFMLAVLPLLPNGRGGAAISLPFAAAILMIPVFDTIAAFWRRTREGRSFLEPDKFHLHHKMLMMGFTGQQSLVILAFFQLLIGIMVITSSLISGFLSFFLLLSVYLMGILFFTLVHIRKEEIVERSKLL